jgi:shikimate dehydrogenase
MVIATGGGIVKRPENRHILRQNGTVVFMDRDLTELSVKGRPLSERDGVGALAAERMPLYKKWSDFTVPVRGVEKTAAEIMDMIFKSAL